MPVTLIILISVCLGSFAQILFKLGVVNLGLTNLNFWETLKIIFSPYILIGLTAFAFSFFLWLKVLAVTPLSFAYPMLSLSYVIVTIASWLLLGESLPLLRVLGLGFIITGISLIAQT